jgi:uncharacterized protein (TIGR03067 family)
MRIAKRVLLLSVVGLIAADEPKKKDDAESFKGNWSIVSMKMDGRSAPEDLVKNFRCRFEEKTYNNTIASDVVEEGSYTIDASKTPRTIDFDIKKGHDEGKKQLGIYKLEGDKLTLVLTEPGSTTRPKSFKAEAGDSLVEVVLQRVKS